MNEREINAFIETVEKYGYHVFPLQENNKIPFKGFAWKERSSNNPELIKQWNTDYGNCNWALDCGKSDIAVVDLDLVVPSEENKWRSEDGLLTLSAMADIAPERLNKEVPNISGLADVLRALKIPDTRINFTPKKGGFHILFRNKQGIRNSSRDIGPGIDTRGVGGYIVLPPSIIAGKYYSNLIAEENLPDLPDFFIEKLKIGKEKRNKGKENADIGKNTSTGVRTDAGSDIGSESDNVLTEAIRFLRQAPTAEEGDGGDMLTLQTAYSLRDIGLLEDSCFHLMQSLWNYKCTPPWKANELKTKVRNAYVYGSGEIGKNSNELIFKYYLDMATETVNPVSEQNQTLTKKETSPDKNQKIGATSEIDPKTDPDPVISRRPFRIPDISSISARDIGIEEPKDRKWLFGHSGKGGLPVGKTGLIAASGGTGKSTLLTQLAASITGGVNRMGGIFSSTRRGSVLLVLAEEEKEDLEQRLFHIRKTRGDKIDLSKLYTICGAGDYRLLEKDRSGNLRHTEHYTDLIKLVKSIPDLKVIFLDPISKLLGSADENNNSEATFFNTSIDLLKQAAPGVNIILAAHNSKSSTAGIDSLKGIETALDQNSVRGAGAFVNDVRWLMSCVSVPPRLSEKLGASRSQRLMAWRVAKSNYSATTATEYFVRGKGGILTPFEIDKAISETEELVTAIRALRLSLTKRTALVHLPKYLKQTKNTVKRLIEEALEDKKLSEYKIKNENGVFCDYIIPFGLDKNEWLEGNIKYRNQDF